MIARIDEAVDSAPIWSKIARFISTDDRELCGEPEDFSIDLGLALEAEEEVRMKVLSVSSPLQDSAQFTGEVAIIKKLLSPLSAADIGTIRCIGMNYKDHVAEMALCDMPKLPEVFTKPSTSLIGPGDNILLPKVAPDAVDIEVELAVIIGKDCKNATIENAMDYVLGYTIANDLTCRDVQKGILQWGYAKSFDTFCPLGPVIVSAGALPDVSSLGVRSTVQGQELQNSNTSELIFPIPELIAYCSKGTTLPKGTVILTGTPAGIGASYDPPRYLKPKGNAKVWIEKIGTLSNGVALEV